MPRGHTIYLGADHGGFPLKEQLKQWLIERGNRVIDLGNHRTDSADDYPLFAIAVSAAVAADRRARRQSLGILSCRSAAGMAMAANKVAGIRAAVATDPRSAVQARKDEDANILALSGDWLSAAEARRIVNQWLDTKASSALRHQRRRRELTRFEQAVPEVIPGVFETTVPAVRKALAKTAAIADQVHLDVADGRFVPTTALADPTVAGRLVLPETTEVHLMVEQPVDYVADWAAVGADRLIAHVEAPGFAAFLPAAKRAGVEAVAALNRGTDPATLEPYLKQADSILLMGVTAGRSGQAFDYQILPVIAELRQKYPRLPISVDGGVNDRTAAPLVAAGAHRLVATSFINQSAKPADALAALRNVRGGDHG